MTGSLAQLVYRGSQKHKNRPAMGAKGTLCPEWTHAYEGTGLGAAVDKHDWPKTQAHELLLKSVESECGRSRYATKDGVAFEAKPTEDGTWHGYPIPWESVPAVILQDWIKSGAVTKRQTKKYWQVAKSNVRWALNNESHE